MKSARTNFKATNSGYILLEVMLATGIFAMVAVALAVALSETLSAGEHLQRESRVMWNLESKMNEVRLKRLVVGKVTLPPDDSGIAYEQEIAPLDLKNEKNQTLAGMYNIVITARWKEQNQPVDLVAQKYVYQP